GLPTLEPFFAAGNPVFGGLESSAKAMAALAIGLPSQAKEPARSGVKFDHTSAGLVLEPEARERLAAGGIAVPPWRVARTEAEARAAYSALGGPGTSVVLKLVSPQALHKSDVGGVLLGISSVDAVAAGHRQLLTTARKLGDERASVLITG